MLVAVLPASPKTAQETIRALLEADQLTSPVGVRAIYRDCSKAPPEFRAHAGFHAVPGDLNDATSLDLGGADTVFVITPPRYDGSDMMQWATVASDNTRLAIQRAGTVKRLVLLSGMGAEEPSGTVRLNISTKLEVIYSRACIGRNPDEPHCRRDPQGRRPRGDLHAMRLFHGELGCMRGDGHIKAVALRLAHYPSGL